MARRNRRTTEEREWKGAFTLEETKAVRKGLGILFERALGHIVAPKFELPNLPDVVRGLACEDVWDLLETAERIRVKQAYNYNDFSQEIQVGGAAAICATSKLFMPDLSVLDQSQLRPDTLPTVLGEYSIAAQTLRAEWQRVRDVFIDLNSRTKRSTAAFYWPCAGALMAVGGVERPELASVERPGNIPADMTVNLRHTSAFVMQYTMLPPIDNNQKGEYEGDASTGVAANLTLVGSHDDDFTSVVWPITSEK